uniref:G domain-containing protein n=1 Tax=Phlebotomus papatasi TaxID=29031 RepID=A0A1B0EZN4_PHLPP
MKKPINQNVWKFFQKHNNAILYSSFMEDHYLKLGYKKSQALQEIIRIKQEQMRLDNGKIKVFPLALKYISTEQVINIHDEKSNNFSIFSQNEEFIFVNKKQDNISLNIEPNWLQDYEYFDEDEGKSKYGTSDLSFPISKIPCNGCGGMLQCAEPSFPGYIPSEIYKTCKEKELKKITCQRCHFLKNYNIALNVNILPEKYLQFISSIAHKPGLGVLIVDLLDFPTSIWSDVHKVIGDQRPLFIVGNKVDLIPKDCRNYLNNIRANLREEVIKKGIREENIKHIALVSATTGYGIEELITNLHHKWGTQGDVYLIGATNVGKSSLFNALLGSDYCKVQACDLIQRATASPWPGTTLRLLKFPILRPSDYRIFLRTRRIISEQYEKGQEAKLRRLQANKTGKVEFATLIGHIGHSFQSERKVTLDHFSMGKPNIEPQVLNEESKVYRNSKWCYDTPGIVLNDQIHHNLTLEEIILTKPTEMLRPRILFFKIGLSIFLAVYSSLRLPILICDTTKANAIYSDLLQTDALQVPQNTTVRPQPWVSLEYGFDFSIVGDFIGLTVADIVFSSIGWVGVNAEKNDTVAFRVWSPEGKGTYLRKPALLSQGFRLHNKRIRDSLAYRIGKAFIKH